MSWQDELPGELTADHDGQSIALRDHPEIRATADIPTLAKRYLDTKTAYGKHMGQSIPLPTNAKPEDIEKWRADHLPKFHKAGLLPTPPVVPGAPDKYEVKYGNENITKLIAPELLSEMRQVAHESGLTQETVNRLTELNEKQFAGLFKTREINKEQTKAAIAELGTKYGKSPEELMALTDNWFSKKGYSEDDVKNMLLTGELLHIPFLETIIEATMNSGESEGLLGGTEAGANDDGERLLKEFSDSTHQQHKAYLAENGKGPINDQINAAFAKKGGNKEFVISG